MSQFLLNFRRGGEVVTNVALRKVFASKVRPVLLEMMYHESYKLPSSLFIFKQGMG
jgi:hypothetical protein